MTPADPNTQHSEQDDLSRRPDMVYPANCTISVDVTDNSSTIQDSEQDDIARRPRMPDQQKEPVEWLIYRLMYLNEEKLQDGPVDMVARAAALAQLYQAKFLHDIDEQVKGISNQVWFQLERIHAQLEQINGNTEATFKIIAEKP